MKPKAVCIEVTIHPRAACVPSLVGAVDHRRARGDSHPCLPASSRVRKARLVRLSVPAARNSLPYDSAHTGDVVVSYVSGRRYTGTGGDVRSRSSP